MNQQHIRNQLTLYTTLDFAAAATDGTKSLALGPLPITLPRLPWVAADANRIWSMPSISMRCFMYSTSRFTCSWSWRNNFSDCGVKLLPSYISKWKKIYKLSLLQIGNKLNLLRCIPRRAFVTGIRISECIGSLMFLARKLNTGANVLSSRPANALFNPPRLNRNKSFRAKTLQK